MSEITDIEELRILVEALMKELQLARLELNR